MSGPRGSLGLPGIGEDEMGGMGGMSMGGGGGGSGSVNAGNNSPGPSRPVPPSPSSSNSRPSTFTRSPSSAGGSGGPARDRPSMNLQGMSNFDQTMPAGGYGVGSTIQNSHTHHYHYHLYQTTINETGGPDKDEPDEDDAADEQEDADMQELLELFPDGIPEELLMDDGSGIPQEVVDEQGNVITVIKPRQKPMKNIFGVHDLSHKEIESLSFFAKVYRFLHDPASGIVARVWSVMMVIAIVTSSVMILVQSMPNLKLLSAIEDITKYIEFYSVALFSLDYVLKLFSVHSYADCILPKPLPYNVLWRFFIQPLNLLDFISVVPFWVQTVLGDGATSGNAISLVFRIIRMFRIVRLLKVAQYSRSIDIFFRVIIQAWDALLLLVFFVGFGSIVFGTLIFICEQGEEDKREDSLTKGKFFRDNIVGNAKEESPFSSIPQSFWFVVTTLTTVGYGDLVPTSTGGKLVGGATQLSGVIFISTPLVIFGTHFQNEFTKELDRIAFLHKRQEKIKKKQEDKEKRAAAKEAEDRERRMAEGGYGIDTEDPMAAAMGLGGGPMPGAIPPSPNGDDDPMGRYKNNNRMSTLNRGQSFMNRGGMGMGNATGGMPGMGMGQPNEPVRPNAGGGMLIQNMQAVGPNGCTCPCNCGARNQGGLMPGEAMMGGVRRNTFAKSNGKLNQTGSMISNPTAADQKTMQNGMTLANQVLPERSMAERSAQAMAVYGGPTQAVNLSAAQILEMQYQVSDLKTLVNQLGGLLIAGGAPQAAIANAMMAAIVPETKPPMARKASTAVKSSSITAPADQNSPEGRSSLTRASIAQPSAGKLSKRDGARSSTSINDPGKPPGSSSGRLDRKSSVVKSESRSSISESPTHGRTDSGSKSISIKPASAATPEKGSELEMQALSSPSAVSTNQVLVSETTPMLSSFGGGSEAMSPIAMSPLPEGPVALSVDQIIPARPKHEFPTQPDGEETIDTTIRMLESLIETPKLSEKLLIKPPFRFLHDIVTSMITKTGFPENYFDATELDPNNLTEIQPKLEFLEKLLDLISIINQTDLSIINPKKIVAGLEHENTNLMLQEFAKAAAAGITVDQITAMMEAQEAAGGGVGAEAIPEGATNIAPEADGTVAVAVAAAGDEAAPLLAADASSTAS